MSDIVRICDREAKTSMFSQDQGPHGTKILFCSNHTTLWYILATILPSSLKARLWSADPNHLGKIFPMVWKWSIKSFHTSNKENNFYCSNNVRYCLYLWQRSLNFNVMHQAKNIMSIAQIMSDTCLYLTCNVRYCLYLWQRSRTSMSCIEQRA